MSKVMDAMQKAAQEQKVAATGVSALSVNAKWTNGAPARQPQEAPAPSASQAVAVTARGAEHPAETSSRIPSAPSAGSRESWDQALELVKRQLETHEQQAARQDAELVKVKAQLAAAEALRAQAEQERERARTRMDAAQHQVAELESAKVTWVRQLEALRECQKLSHAARMAAEELDANTTLVARIAQSQQRVGEDLAYYQQRGEALRQQVEALRFQLAQALTFTGTIDRPQPSREEQPS